MAEKNNASTVDDEPTPFVEFLAHHNRGTSERELAAGLQTVLSAVKDTGKKGSLTYKVTIEPEDNFVVIADEIKLNIPEHNRPASVFYTDDKSRLYRNDPDQMTIDDLARGAQ